MAYKDQEKRKATYEAYLKTENGQRRKKAREKRYTEKRRLQREEEKKTKLEWTDKAWEGTDFNY